MNSRRLMASPAARTKSGIKRLSHFGLGIVPFATPKPAATHVRFGSKADIAASPTNVRFTPNSGHRRQRLGHPLTATSVRCRRRRQRLWRRALDLLPAPRVDDDSTESNLHLAAV